MSGRVQYHTSLNMSQLLLLLGLLHGGRGRAGELYVLRRRRVRWNWLVGWFWFQLHFHLTPHTASGDGGWGCGVRCVPFLMNPSYTTGWRVVYSLVGWLSLFLRGPFMSSLFVRTSLLFLFYVQDLSLALCLFVSNQTLCSA
ncbi:PLASMODESMATA CALLOSE-BINDING PROTEIN 2, partial [Zea mays]